MLGGQLAHQRGDVGAASRHRHRRARPTRWGRAGVVAGPPRGRGRPGPAACGPVPRRGGRLLLARAAGSAWAAGRGLAERGLLLRRVGLGLLGLLPRARGGCSAGGRPRRRRPPTTASSAPTSTVSSSPTMIFAACPPTGDGISVSTLSVETSSSGSSTSTSSPSCLSQRVTVPSVTRLAQRRHRHGGAVAARRPSVRMPSAPGAAAGCSCGWASAAGASACAGVCGSAGSWPPRRGLGAPRRRRTGRSLVARPEPAVGLLATGVAARGRRAVTDDARSAPTSTVSSSLDEDLLQHAGDRRRDLGVDLVGRDLEQRLVDLDVVADLLEPAGDGALGDALAEGGICDRVRRGDR